MKISVVICTVDRAPELRVALESLRHQLYLDFEVVVVAGPCSDGTDELLAEVGDSVRVVRNDEVHISRSRNLGIDAAAGEIVAFMDDDAIPAPSWLAGFADAFADPDLAGAGGFVRLPDGIGWQQRWAVCSRAGDATAVSEPPGEEHSRPGADPFVYTLGTNAAFRRSALEAVDGFDEEIEYYQDETDLCARLIDAGLRVRQIDTAEVIHRIRPSRIRDRSRRVTDVFSVVKNHVYLARMNEAPDADASIGRFADFWRDEARSARDGGLIDEAAYQNALTRVDDGLAAGEAAAARGERLTRKISPREPELFSPYPVVPAPDGRRRVAFLTSEYPPASFGGVGRYTQDLATGLAARGWEVHVVVTGGGPEQQLNFEGGAWVHSVPAFRVTTTLPVDAASAALDRIAAGHHALLAIEERFGEVEIVSAPLWSGESLLASIDRRWAAVTTLVTSMRTVVDLYPSWPQALVMRLLDLESETLRHARHLHAISDAILENVRADYPRETARTPADVVHLGVRDRRGIVSRTRDANDGRVRILFVGRLERRKGVDTLLEAVVGVLRRHPEAELVLVGRDIDDNALGTTREEAFRARHAADPGLLDQVRFAGEVDEESLYRAYADADVFVGPSLYESFGLVHAEALMMGLPVVGCGTGGMVELVDEGDTGLLIPPDDADALKGALEKLVTDASLRRRMGAAARARYEEGFSLERAVERTAEAFCRVADSHEREVLADAALARVLAETLERVAGEGPVPARKLADALLGGEGDDPLNEIALVWSSPASEFIDGVYTALLRRSPEEAMRAHLLQQLAGGRPRGDLVREVGWSAEARAQGRGTEWLGRMLELEGWTEEDACRSAFSQPSDERFVQDVADLLCLDAAAREEARRLVEAQLATGSGRLAAALALVHSPLPVRPAPDFDGWEPMLMTLGTGRGAGPRERPDRGLTSGAAGLAARKLGTASRLPARAREVLAAVRQTNARTEDASFALGQLQAQLRDLQDAERHVGSEIIGWLGKLTDVVMRAETATERSRNVIAAVQATADDARRRAHDNASQLDLLQRKLDAVAIDLRDRLPPSLSTPDLPAPHVPDPERFQGRVSELGDDIRVNLGSGEKPVAGYLNIDMRELQDVDVVADVRRLPFEPGSLAEIMSAHLVEHFRQHQLEVAILPYWRSLLRAGGVLRIVCPNWEEMARRLSNSEMSWDEFKVLTFGLQDYDGDDHFAMYTPATLERALRSAGFTDVEVVVEARQNGICPEMEVIARTEAATRPPTERELSGQT